MLMVSVMSGVMKEPVGYGLGVHSCSCVFSHHFVLEGLATPNTIS